MIIFHNAKFVAVNEQNDTFEQLWIDDGRIVYTGPAKEIPDNAEKK